MGFNLKRIKENANKSTLGNHELFDAILPLILPGACLMAGKKVEFIKGVLISSSCEFVSIRG